MRWSITHDDTDILITGPSGLAITLRDFDPTRMQRDDLPPEALGSLLQRQWRYPLEDGGWLEGISTGDTAALDHPELHRLYVGTCVQWTLPEQPGRSVACFDAHTDTGGLTMAHHWLTRTKTAIHYAGNGALWLPGSTTWRHYMPDLQHPARAIAEARRRGWLAGSGIPQLTRKGYQEA